MQLATTQSTPIISNNYTHNFSTHPDAPKILPLLSLGAKFIPPPRPRTLTELKANLAKLRHRLWVRAYFKNFPDPRSNHYDPILRVPPSTWMPDLRQFNPFLYHLWNEFEQNIKTVQSNLPTYTSTSTPYLSRLVKQAISLKPHIRITNSDKNLGLVILDIAHYEQLAFNHLDDTNTYRILPSEEAQNLMASMFHQLENLHTLIMPQLEDHHRKYLRYAWKYRLPNFHVLPKLHKQGALKGRPIVGAVAWHTTPVSKLLDRLLAPHLDRHPQILKNTAAAINLLRNVPPLPPNCLLVTLDVTSLYTNIRLNLLEELVDTEFGPTLGSMLRFINNHNYFQFADNVYQQTEGIAMGTNCACTLANLYLAHKLDVHLQRHPQVLAYGRYIDDIILVWNSTQTALSAFTAWASTLVPGIELTGSSSSTNIAFLDVSFSIRGQAITYSPYAKPLNKYLYLPFHSSHPRAMLRGWLKGEAIRLLRHSPSPGIFSLEIKLFKARLAARGYPKAFIDQAIACIQWSQEAHEAALAPRPPPLEPPTPTTYLVLRHTLQPSAPLQTLIREYNQTFTPDTGTVMKIAWSVSPSVARLLLGTMYTRETSPPRLPLPLLG